MNNREQLISWMFEQDIDRREVAELLLVDRDTVDCWLLPHESHRHTEVPDMAIELMRLKLDIKAEENPDQASRA